MEDLELLFEEYASTSGKPIETIRNTYNMLGESYLNVINRDLKKKVPTQEVEILGNKISPNPPSIQEAIQPLYNQQSNRVNQDQLSSELDILEQKPSTESALEIGQSSSTENFNLETENKNTPPDNSLGGNLLYLNDNELIDLTRQENENVLSLDAKNRARQINSNNKYLDNLDQYYTKKAELEKLGLDDSSLEAPMRKNNRLIVGIDNNIPIEKLSHFGTDENGNDIFQDKNGVGLIFKDGILQLNQATTTEDEEGNIITLPPKIYGKDFSINEHGLVQTSDEKYTPYQSGKIISFKEGDLITSKNNEFKDINGQPISFDDEVALYKDWEEKGYGKVTSIGDNNERPVFQLYASGVSAVNKLYGIDKYNDEVDSKNREDLRNIEQGARNEEEIKEQQIRLIGEANAAKYNYAATPQEIEQEQLNMRANQIMSNGGYTYEQAYQAALQEKLSQRQGDIAVSTQLVNDILGQALKVENGEDRTTLSKFDGDTKLTDSEKQVWSRLSNDENFGKWFNEKGYKKFGRLGEGLETNASTTTLRKRIYDTYMIDQMEEDSKWESVIKTKRDDQKRMNISNAFDNGDVSLINAERQTRQGIKDGIGYLQGKQQSLSTQYNQDNKNFDILFKRDEESAKEFADYKNGDLGGASLATLKNIANGAVNVIGDIVGGVMTVATPFSETASKYVNAYDYTTRDAFQVFNQGISDSYKEYSKNGEKVRITNGKAFRIDKDENWIYDSKLSENQSEITRNWKFEKEDSETNLAGVGRMFVNQGLMMFAPEFIAGKLASSTALTYRVSRTAELAANALGKNNLLSRNLMSFATDVALPKKLHNAYSAMVWGEQTNKNNVVAAQEAGLSKEAAYLYGLFGSATTMALLKVSPDAKFFGEYKQINSEVFKLLSENKLKQATNKMLEVSKKFGRNVVGEGSQEELERSFQNLINAGYNQVYGENEKGEQRFSTGNFKEFLDTQSQTAMVVGGLELIALARRGGVKLNLKGNTRLQNLILAANTPDFERQYLKAVEDNDVLNINQKDIAETKSHLQTIRKYTKEIPPNSNLTLAETEKVILSMQEIDRLKQSTNTALSDVVQGKINEQKNVINSVFETAKKRNENNNAESSTPTEQTQETVQAETTNGQTETEPTIQTEVNETASNQETTTETIIDDDFNENDYDSDTESFADNLLATLDEIKPNKTAENQEQNLSQYKLGDKISRKSANGTIQNFEVVDDKKDVWKLQDENGNITNWNANNNGGFYLTEPNVENNTTSENPIQSIEENNTEPKPIRQLGTGANVYFETDKYRLNENSNGTYSLNIGQLGELTPIKSEEFSDLNEAIYVSEYLQKNAPKGVLGKQNTDDFVKWAKEEYQQSLNQDNNKVDNSQENTYEEKPTINEVTITKETKVVEPTIFEKDGYKLEIFPDGNEVLTSTKGKVINKYTEKGKINANYSKNKQKFIGGKTDNEIRIEERQRNRIALLNFIPSNAREAVLEFFANGGKITSDDISKQVLGNSVRLEARGKAKRKLTDYKWAFLGAKATSIDGAVLSIMDEYPYMDAKKLSDEIIDVINSYSSARNIREEVVDLYNRSVDPYYGLSDSDIAEMEYLSLSENEKALVDAVNAENNLSEEEKEDYYRNEFNKQLDSLPLEQQQEIYKNEQTRFQQNDTKRTEGTQSESESVQGGAQEEGSRRPLQEPKSTSPEYQQLLKDKETQEARVKSTKESLDRASRNTNANFQADQENIFGERPQAEGMFDERADGNAGKEIIANAKREYDQAKSELAKTNKSIRDFESGIASGTGEIDFSIIGEQGAIELSKALNSGVLLKALDKAKKLESEGKSNAEIYNETGWEKGTDGKWRIELDYDISINNPGFSVNGNKIETKLSELIKYHALFASYPQLKNVTVRILDSTAMGKDTEMSVIGNTIYINKDYYGGINYSGAYNIRTLKAQPDLGKLLHEIQHLIQGIEGFAQGTNPRRVANLLAEKVLGISGKPNELAERNRVAQLAEKIGGKDWQSKFRKYNTDEKLEFGAVIYEAYAGEVEARNAERRLKFSQQIRNEYPPSYTEDVKREYQVLIKGGLNESDSSLQPFTPIPQSAYDKLVKRLLGVFKNFGGKVITTKAEVDAKLKEFGVADYMIKAFHGSPHRFDRFSTEFMGSGEGAQAFGWGLYFTDLESIATHYAKALFKNKIIVPLSNYQKGKNESFILNNILEYDTKTQDVLKFILQRSTSSLDFEKRLREERDNIKRALDSGYLQSSGYGHFTKEDLKNTYKLLKYPSSSDVRILVGSRNLYKVSLHKGKTPSEYTWLEWDKPIGDRINKLNLDSLIGEYYQPTKAYGNYKKLNSLEELKSMDGNSFYSMLSQKLGGGKEASLFLLENGIDGIKYPAESISRGATSDNARGFNYVVFDENSVTIEEVVEFMKTKDGEIYGAKFPDGTIYLNPEKLNANTPIHEFSHLWEQIMPKAWAKGLEIFKQTKTGKDLYNKLKKENNYSHISEEQLWSESLNTLIGNLGEQKYHQKPKGKMAEFIDWFKTTMGKFLNRISPKYKNMVFGKETQLRFFTDTVLGDLFGERELTPETNTQNNSRAINYNIVSNGEIHEIPHKRVMPKKLIESVVNEWKANGEYSARNLLFNSGWYEKTTKQIKSEIEKLGLKDFLADQANKIKENAVVVAENKKITSEKEEADNQKRKSNSNSTIESYSSANNKITVKGTVRKAGTIKRRWFANRGGDMEHFLGTLEKAEGKTKLAIRRANITAKELKEKAKELKFADDNLINDALNGVEGAIDKLPIEIADKVRQMRAQIDGLTDRILTNGYVSPETAVLLEENKGKYVNRSYSFFEKKDDFGKVFRRIFGLSSLKSSKHYTQAVKEFAGFELEKLRRKKEWKNKSEEEIGAEALRLGELALNEYIHELENEFKSAKSSKIATDLSPLMRRKNVSKTIRDLLGEYTDPKLNYVMTIAKMENMINQREALEGVKKLGMGTVFFEFNDPKRPKDAVVKISSDSNQAYAPLNGLYTTQNFKEQLLDQSEAITNDVLKLWLKFTGMIKFGKTVLSPITQSVNFSANTGFLVMNGLYDVRNFQRGFEVMYDEMLKDNSTKSKYIEELIELGILDSNVNLREIQNDFHQDFEKDIISRFEKANITKIMRNIIVTYPSKMYKASDDFFKAYSFFHEADSYSRAIYKKKYSELQGEEKSNIQKIASEVTKNTLANYGRKYKGADAPRKLSANFLGNFLSFQAESIRTLINAIHYAKKDLKNPNTRGVGIRRLSGIISYLGVYGATTTYLTKLSLIGVGGLMSFFEDDDENENAKAFNRMVAPWDRSVEKYVEQLPDGTYNYFSYGKSNPYGITFRTINAITNGSEISKDGGLGAALWELSNSFVGTEMTANVVYQMLSNEKPNGKEIGDVYDRLFYGTDKLKPGFVKLIQDEFDKKENNDFEWQNLIGIKKQNVDPTKSLGITFNIAQKKVNDLSSEIYSLEKQLEKNEITEKKFEEEGLKRLKKIKAIKDEYIKDEKAFLYYGADPTYINKKKNKDWNMEKNNFNSDLLNGN